MTRPHKFGNPFTAGDAIRFGYATTEMEARAACVEAFRGWLDSGRCAWPIEDSEQRGRKLLDGMPELIDCTALMCFCSTDGPCHGDVLAARVAEMIRPAR